jgi:hypothetical protein
MKYGHGFALLSVASACCYFALSPLSLSLSALLNYSKYCLQGKIKQRWTTKDFFLLISARGLGKPSLVAAKGSVGALFTSQIFRQILL